MAFSLPYSPLSLFHKSFYITLYLVLDVIYTEGKKKILRLQKSRGKMNGASWWAVTQTFITDKLIEYALVICYSQRDVTATKEHVFVCAPSFDHLHPKLFPRDWFPSSEGHTWRGTAPQLMALTAFVTDTWRRINGLVFMRWVFLGAVDVPVHAKSGITARRSRQALSGPTGACRPISRIKMVTNGERRHESALTSPTQSHWVNTGSCAVNRTGAVHANANRQTSALACFYMLVSCFAIFLLY